MNSSATHRQINSPEDIKQRSGLEVPPLLLPDPGKLFAERALRLRQLAAGHAMRDYLMLMAVVCEAQHARLQQYPEVTLPDAAQAAAVQAWDDYSASIEKDRKFLIDQGLTVTSPTEADRQAMIDKTQPVVDKLLAENAWAKELTDKIRAVK